MYIISERQQKMKRMGKRRDTEEKILERAIEALRCETGLRLKIERKQVQKHEYDALVRLKPGGQEWIVEIKNWIQHANLGALTHQIKNLPGEGLLIADYVNPKMAKRLRDQNVQFIDTVGNAFINQPPVYVYVTAKRREEDKDVQINDGAKRAFEPKGLMVIYAFLCNPELVHAPYRDIAERAGVAVGTVGWVINGLKAAGLMRAVGDNKRREITQYRKLLDRWTEVWPEKLKPKFLVGKFLADDPYWWKNIDITTYDGYWGGEIAAARYTNYLKPQVATIYLPEHARMKLLREARLRKATEGNWQGAGVVHIYEPFWPEQNEEMEDTDREGLTPPVLTYADLVATGETRNLEVAGRIYDEYIAKFNREG